MSRFQHIGGDAPTAPTPRGAAAPVRGYADFMAEADGALRRGRFEAALRWYGRALEEDRAQPEPWCGQVRALIEMAQPLEALTWLEQAQRVVGESPQLLGLWAIATARTGALDDALAWCDRAMKAGPDAPEVWLARAEVLYLNRQGRLAPATLDKAHERAPGPETARRCAEVALTAADLPTARGWLERAVRAAPDDPLVALRFGVYWDAAGHPERAHRELTRALALEPGLEPARLALDSLGSPGLLDRARAAWRRWTRG
ncbi:MAG: tetratricopeptide repeat protein [Myxococcales bacterium]|nr:tetratricopeptide repeat protein [Myxococcales bacterium]